MFMMHRSPDQAMLEWWRKEILWTAKAFFFLTGTLTEQSLLERSWPAPSPLKVWYVGQWQNHETRARVGQSRWTMKQLQLRRMRKGSTSGASLGNAKHWWSTHHTRHVRENPERGAQHQTRACKHHAAGHRSFRQKSHVHGRESRSGTW